MMSSQRMKQRRSLCVTFPIYREESENNIYDRKKLKMKIGKDPPGQRDDDMEKTEGEYWDDKVCDEEVLRRIGEKKRTI